ncbi:FHA domain-containing protein [Nocardia sp. R16R-3T]
MRNAPSTVGIAPGNGLIARFGAVVVYLAGETPSADRILGAIEAVSDARHPGAAIAQRLAAVVFGGNSEPAPFGVIAPTADGTVVLLRGQVSAEIQGAEGTRRLAGARAFTWVDEIVREPVRSIAVGADTAFPIHELPRTDLRAGIVAGGGFVLRIAARRTGKSAATRARTTGAPSPAAEPPPTAAAGFEALPDSDEPTEKAGPTRSTDSDRTSRGSAAQAEGFGEPTDKAGPMESTAAARPGAALSQARPKVSALSDGSGQTGAEGISTPAMSARKPEDNTGTRAGMAARPEPIALHKIPALQGVRPRPLRPIGGANNSEAGQPVGTLVLADGSAYPLDRAYVVGRSPMIDETVRAGTATPIAVPRDRHVSRVHAYVSVDRGKVYVRDAATPAGTFIAAPGADEWTRIGTTPTELHSGWSLRIGQRILTYRTQDRPEHPTPATSKRSRS